jgi:hypothetical protein
MSGGRETLVRLPLRGQLRWGWWLTAATDPSCFPFNCGGLRAVASTNGVDDSRLIGCAVVYWLVVDSDRTGLSQTATGALMAGWCR